MLSPAVADPYRAATGSGEHQIFGGHAGNKRFDTFYDEAGNDHGPGFVGLGNTPDQPSALLVADALDPDPPVHACRDSGDRFRYGGHIESDEAEPDDGGRPW